VQTEGTPSGIRYGFQSPEAAAFPSIIVLENTTVCNLRCIHCPQGQGYPEREDYHGIPTTRPNPLELFQISKAPAKA